MGSHVSAVLLENNRHTFAYDSAAPNRIPRTADAVFPYMDGRFAWSAQALFPGRPFRRITVTGDPAADIIDFEPGLVHDPDTLRNFVDERNRKHGDACVYCDRSDLAQVVVPALGPDRKYNVWLATLDGSKPIAIVGPGHLVAVQFYNEPSQAYDLSVVYDMDWLLDIKLPKH